MTVGDTMGEGDLLSAALWWSVIKLSGLELSIKSGETHLKRIELLAYKKSIFVQNLEGLARKLSLLRTFELQS